MKALVLVDVQNDFVDGALGVGYDKWVPAWQRIEQLCASGNYDFFIFTRDAHPMFHCSFAPQGGPWPAHCVAGTAGASLFWKAEHFLRSNSHRACTIFKGEDQGVEEYGIDILEDNLGLAGGHRSEGCIGWRESVTQCDFVGLCYDFCVANCARMTSLAHPNVECRVIADASVAIDAQAQPDFGKAIVV